MVFAGGCAADILTPASKCNQSRPLPRDPCQVLIVILPLRAVRPVRREAPIWRGTSAVGCPLRFPVTERGAVLSADRVVAGRRCLIAPARLDRPDAPVRCRGASVAHVYTGYPTCCCRIAGRSENGPSRARAAAAGWGSCAVSGMQPWMPGRSSQSSRLDPRVVPSCGSRTCRWTCRVRVRTRPPRSSPPRASGVPLAHKTRWMLLCCQGCFCELVVEVAGEVSLEGAHGLSLGLSFVDSAVHVGAALGVVDGA